MFPGLDPFTGSPVSFEELLDAIERRSVRELRAEYELRLAQNPQDAWLILATAFLALVDGALPEGAKRLTEALSQLDGQPAAHLLMVDLHQLAGRPDLAVEALRDFHIRWPGSSAIAAYIAWSALTAQGPHGAAVALAALAEVPADGRDITFFVAKATALLASAAWSEALEAADAALARCAASEEGRAVSLARAEVLFRSWMARGWACGKLGRDQDALEAAEKADALLSGQLEPTLLRLQALLDQGEAGNVLRMIDALPEEVRSRPELAVKRERALFRAGRSKEGADAMDERASKLPWWGARLDFISAQPDLVGGKVGIGAGRLADGTFDALGPNYDPARKIASLRGRLGSLGLQGHLTLPPVDAAQEANEPLASDEMPNPARPSAAGHDSTASDTSASNAGVAPTPAETQRRRAAPLVRVIVGLLVGLYPGVVALLTILGWTKVETYAAWAPVVLLFLTLTTYLPVRALRMLHPPVQKGFHVALSGLAAALVVRLFIHQDGGLAWQWWFLVVIGWVHSMAISAAAPLWWGTKGDLMRGEHRVAAFGQTSRKVLHEPLLKFCSVSAFAANLEVDLRDCGIAKSPVIIDLDVWASRVTLRIRPSWTLADIQDELLCFGKLDGDPVYPPNDGMPPDIAIRGVFLFSTVVYSY